MKPKADIDIVKQQIRALSVKLDKVNRTVINQTPPIIDSVPEIVPPINNFCDNTDCIFSEETYNATTFAEDDKVLAGWLAVPQSSNSAYSPSSGATEANSTTTGLSIRNSLHSAPTGGSRVIKWDEATGSILFTGGHRLVSKMFTKPANAGNEMHFRMQLSRVTGASAIDEHTIMKVSIWDNNDVLILTGTKPVLTVAKVGTHSGGTIERQYILEIQMADGRRFYSDTSIPASSKVTNTLATMTSTDYVTVSWSAIVGEARYRVYRRQTTGDTNWYLVGTVTNGSTIIKDFGGADGGTWTVPTTFDNTYKEYQRAEYFLEDIGMNVVNEGQVYEVSVPFNVPNGYVQDGDQYIQIEFLKSDYTATTTTEIASNSLRIDRVGLSYNHGRWHPSSRDLTKTVTPTTPTTPIPTGGGGTGGGGFEPQCVTRNTMIELWDGTFLPAKEVVMGDALKSWNGKKFIKSTVKRIIPATASAIAILYSGQDKLTCSLSHRLITTIEDRNKGIPVIDLINMDRAIYIRSGEGLKKAKIDYYEILRTPTPVITFELEEGKRNYFGNGWLGANNKSPDL